MGNWFGRLLVSAMTEAEGDPAELRRLQDVTMLAAECDRLHALWLKEKKRADDMENSLSKAAAAVAAAAKSSTSPFATLDFSRGLVVAS